MNRRKFLALLGLAAASVPTLVEAATAPEKATPLSFKTADAAIDYLIDGDENVRREYEARVNQAPSWSYVDPMTVATEYDAGGLVAVHPIAERYLADRIGRGTVSKDDAIRLMGDDPDEVRVAGAKMIVRDGLVFHPNQLRDLDEELGVGGMQGSAFRVNAWPWYKMNQPELDAHIARIEQAAAAIRDADVPTLNHAAVATGSGPMWKELSFKKITFSDVVEPR